MSELTGLNCVVVNDWHGSKLEHPSWVKCRILDIFPQENDFLYFDADIWCIKPWNPKHIFESNGRKFMGVVEPEHNAIDAECDKWDINREVYFNGGLLMFSREHKEMFNTALKYHPFGRWYEQTPLNICSIGTPKHILPKEFNFLNHAASLILASLVASFLVGNVPAHVWSMKSTQRRGKWRFSILTIGGISLSGSMYGDVVMLCCVVEGIILLCT